MKPGDLVRIKEEFVWAPAMQHLTLVFLHTTATRSIMLHGGMVSETQMGEFLRADGKIVQCDVTLFEVVQRGEPVG